LLHSMLACTGNGLFLGGRQSSGYTGAAGFATEDRAATCGLNRWHHRQLTVISRLCALLGSWTQRSLGC